MFKKIAAELEVMLKRRDFCAALDLVSTWNLTCASGDTLRLLDACNPKIRPNVTVLLRDVLSQYPNILLGCPMLFFVTLDNPDNPQQLFDLPYPSDENKKPCEELEFVDWVACGTQLPLSIPFQPKRHQNKLNWRVPTAIVALFELKVRTADPDEIRIPAEWWGRFFLRNMESSIDFCVNLEGDLLINYPDSIDIAEVQQAGAQGLNFPKPRFFQGDLSWAYERGMRFSERFKSLDMDCKTDSSI